MCNTPCTCVYVHECMCMCPMSENMGFISHVLETGDACTALHVLVCVCVCLFPTEHWSCTRTIGCTCLIVCGSMSNKCVHIYFMSCIRCHKKSLCLVLHILTVGKQEAVLLCTTGSM
ncbi:unnamed protein product, partial [Discosporangium mesarthrocarpum]